MTEKDFEMIQTELDKHYYEYAKKDFLIKLEHYKNISDLLSKRNELLKSEKSQKTFPNFFATSFAKYMGSYDIMPVKGEDIDTDWISSIDVRYEDDYGVYVEIELNENEYLANKKIFKRFNLQSEKTERSELEWKTKSDALVFKYFEDDNEDIAVFDILYEGYVNALFYYTIENDEDFEDCCDNEGGCCENEGGYCKNEDECCESDNGCCRE